MSEQVSSVPEAAAGGAPPTPLAAVAIPLGLVVIVATATLSIKAGPASLLVTVIFGAGFLFVALRKRALLGMTQDSTAVALGIAFGLSAFLSVTGLKFAADQKEREDAARQVVMLGQTDSATQQARLAALDEPMLKALGKVAPALEAQERSRRAAVAQKEKERAELAAREQKRRRVAELQESLTSLSRTDYEAREAALRELHELEPDNPEYRRMALELAAQMSKERAVREDPETSLMMTNLSWGKGGFGTVMLLNADVKNVSALTLRDFTIECTNMGPSGTALNTNSQVVYEQIGPGQTRRLRRFNMGLMANQAAQTSCQITDAEVVG